LNNRLFSTPRSLLTRRHATGSLWHGIFIFSTVIGLVALAALLFSIIDQTAGLVVISDDVDRTTLVAATPFDQLSQAELVGLLRAKLTNTRIRTLERADGSLDAIPIQRLRELVIEQIVKPTIVETYPLFDSLFRRKALDAEIQAVITEKYPGAKVEFRFWLNPQFLANSMSAVPELAGIRTAIMGSLWIILITIGVAFPIGIGAAVYLQEYASNSLINRLIQTNIDNLAGVPSIIYGILGLAIFVRTLSFLTSGSVFGVETANGRTILSAGLTMALLILPILIINAQEAIRAVPNSLRMASYGLGATKWQTIWAHVLPYAFPGILTGTILAISRALGETAPLILVGASSLINKDPSGVFSFFTALPIQIYNWTSRPQAEFRNIAAAAIIVLLVLLLSLNSIAIILRNRLSRRSS
jgi:phosphate transport system permease protein